MIVAIEDEFQINITDIDSESLFTVKDIIDFVIKYKIQFDDIKKNPGFKYNDRFEFGGTA